MTDDYCILSPDDNYYFLNLCVLVCILSLAEDSDFWRPNVGLLYAHIIVYFFTLT